MRTAKGTRVSVSGCPVYLGSDSSLTASRPIVPRQGLLLLRPVDSPSDLTLHGLRRALIAASWLQMGRVMATGYCSTAVDTNDWSLRNAGL